MSLMSWIKDFDSNLGHGRRTELYFSIASILMFIAFMHPIKLAATQTFGMFGYEFNYFAAAIPWLVYFCFTFYGLIANIHDWRKSREARMAGAAIGMALWLWLTLLHFPNALPELLIAQSVPGLLFSAMIFKSAVLNLPPPGGTTGR